MKIINKLINFFKIKKKIFGLFFWIILFTIIIISSFFAENVDYPDDCNPEFGSRGEFTGCM